MSFAPRRWNRAFCFSIVALIAPPAGAQPTDAAPFSRIAFGSCALQTKPQPVWDAVLAAKPQLFIFLGDNIYGDSEDLDVLKAKYGMLGSIPGFQRLRAAVPIMATWDDHDYGVNDGGVEFAQKVASQKIFLDFFREPEDSPRRKREGVYYARTFGPEGKRVQVILLDTRYFRSALKKKPKEEQKPGVGPYLPNDDPAATMLGDAQWQWLGEQLQKPAELRIIGSSIQVIAEDHSWERWGEMPRERERLFKLIATSKAGGVVFISGDRHLAELSMLDGGVGYPLFDLTASGLNQAAKRWRFQEVNRHRVQTMNWGDHFGLIAVDWETKAAGGQPDPTVSLQIRDVAGEIAIGSKLPLSALQPGAIQVPPPKPGDPGTQSK